MHKFFRLTFPVLVIASMLLVACSGGGSGATQQAPAGSNTQAPAAPAATTAQAATTALAATTASGATSAPAATSASGATSAPASTTASSGTTAPVTGGSLKLPSSCSSVTLQYWTPLTGPDGPFMNQLVNNFNSANPNIKVTETDMSDYVTQYGTAAASDTLPDVAIVNEDQVATQAFRNVIRPMDTQIAQMGLDKNDYPAVAWGAGTIGGKQYAVPLSFVAMTMYYNADLFKAAGIANSPTNAQEFAAAADATNKNGISFFEYDYLRPEATHFIGLQNYIALFQPSNVTFHEFWNALGNTVQFVVYSVPFLVIIPLALAMLLNTKTPGRNFFWTKNLLLSVLAARQSPW